jgi:hypothetical protein
MKLCLVLALMMAAAQSPNVSGRWAVEAPATSGENFQLGAASGTLTLDHTGDAVTGTWKGRMPEPWKLAGRVKGNSFELESETRQIPATRNDEPTTVPRRWIFRGTAEGDKMSGSMQLAGGDGEPPSQPFTAVRKR